MSGSAFSAKSNSFGWYAVHEMRLIWRDFASLITGGKPRRVVIVGAIITAFIIGLHMFVANIMRAPLASGIVADKATLLLISGFAVMLFSLMFSQAIESVTRAYYARSDLDLLLSSPATSRRLFQVRTSMLAVHTTVFAILIASPLINVLGFMDHPRWFSAYLVIVCLGGFATCFAVLLTLLLFRTVGAAKTRLIAQIISAIVGAGFIISLQVMAIMFGEGISRLALFTSADTVARAPDLDSWFWLPAQAIMGQGWPLMTLVAASGLSLILVIAYSARRFAVDAQATSGLVEGRNKTEAFSGFQRRSNMSSVLRRKEWDLLKRDPWLLSQSLQQLLYLFTPGMLLWVNYGSGFGVYYVVIPVVVMAAGQLAGGLSWVTISGEDAHELIDTSPVTSRAMLRAKSEAVIVVVGLATSPFLIALLWFSPRAAVCLAIGILMATCCAVMIQLWHRSQCSRSLFRRRQVSSKTATISEAAVSIIWATGAALAFRHGLFLIPFALIAGLLMWVAWLLRPQGQV
ncbi:MAG: permease [Rhizobiaceae bacterium]|nr:permease [Rhizobiaceae bacterium]